MKHVAGPAKGSREYIYDRIRCYVPDEILDSTNIKESPIDILESIHWRLSHGYEAMAVLNPFFSGGPICR